jgi:hypothetical protein
MKWYMENEPEMVLELYRNHKMMDLEDLLAKDTRAADEYIKSLVSQGMSELAAEDRAVELILAPRDGPADSENPPKPVPPDLQEKIIDRLDALEEALARSEGKKVVNLPPRS